MNANTTQATMRKAFDLVAPDAHAKRLASLGLISAKSAESVSWRDRISALVTLTDLDAAGVTIGQVAEAIEYMTATTATVTPCRIGHRAGDPYVGPDRDGYLVQAAGYRMGPAGDH